VGDEGGQPYFVMRYMNGGSLSERIKAKVMSIEEAASGSSEDRARHG
jgi:hypothetical protein